MHAKGLLFTAIVTGALLATSPAQADVFPVFTINPGALGGSLGAFTADQINGQYNETITFGAGTFSVSILWQAGQFVQDPSTSLSVALTAGETGLGSNYNLYALFTGTGTFSTGSGGVASFSLNPGGNLGVYLDNTLGANTKSTFAAPATGASSYTVIPGAGVADVQLGSGSAINGSGNLSCSAGLNCGSFGQTTSFLLTAAGSSFFALPIPFYELSFQNGQFNGFTPTVGSTQGLNGSLNVTFGRVPEPTTLALVGIALVGLGASAKRRNS